jgi:hypothetical protein
MPHTKLCTHTKSYVIMCPARFQLVWVGLLQTTPFILLLFGTICSKTIQSASCHHMWQSQTIKSTAKTLYTHYKTCNYMPCKVSACFGRVAANHNIHTVALWGYLLKNHTKCFLPPHVAALNHEGHSQNFVHTITNM